MLDRKKLKAAAKVYRSAKLPPPDPQSALGAVRFRGLVAGLIISWANLESQFLGIAKALLKTDAYRAEVIYYSFNGTAARMDFISRLAKMYVSDAAMQNRVLGYLKRFHRLSATRNEYAHGVYQYPRNARKLVPLTNFGSLVSVRFNGDFKGNNHVRFRAIDRATMNELEMAVEGCNALNDEVSSLLRALPRFVRHLPPAPRHTHHAPRSRPKNPARRSRRS